MERTEAKGGAAQVSSGHRRPECRVWGPCRWEWRGDWGEMWTRSSFRGGFRTSELCWQRGL